MRFLEILADWLFGYDYFISYAHDDGTDYPRKLFNELKEARYSVFLDTSVYVAGDDLGTQTERRIRMSRSLVVVTGPKALASRWVKAELDSFERTGRAPIIINLNGALDAGHKTELGDRILNANWLWIEDKQGRSDDGPSPETIKALKHSFTARRVETRRRRALLGGAVVGLSIVIATIVIATWWQNSLRSDEAQRANAFASQAELALEARQYEEAALFALAATIPRRDGLVPDRHRRLFASAASNYYAFPLMIGPRVSGAVRAVEFHTDTDRLYIGTNDGEIWQFDRGDLVYDTAVPAHDTYVTALTISPDGSMLASVGGDNRLIVWDTESDLLDAEFQSLPDGIFGTAVAFSPTEPVIYSGAAETTIRRWDTEPLSPSGEFSNYTPQLIGGGNTGRRNRVNDVAVSPDGTRLAIATWDNTVDIIDASSGELLFELDGLPSQERSGGNWDQVQKVSFLPPDGRVLVTGSFDGILRYWDGDTGMLLDEIEPDEASRSLNGYSIDSLAVSADGEVLATGFRNGDILVRRTVDGGFLLGLYGHNLPVDDLTLSSDNRTLTSASLDGYVWIWDLEALGEHRPIGRLCDALGLSFGNADPDRLSAIEQRAAAVSLSFPQICDEEHRDVRVGPLLDFP
ncbi:MAG: TIR domain-containing protein [Roseovarius confluentis]|uniref:toll/interleukin-1 receptor domain-containing protein n=1 Tax=Roseovarius sp. TaxID=1486281 RepID=UPI0032EC3CC7